MRVLVLGGGGFLGFHAVQSALRAGHEVTVFSRSAASPTPGVSVLVGDRTGDLAALRGQYWDLVVDTFTDPQPGAPAVRRAAQLLSDSVAGYVYVSGMSVYAPDGPATPDEAAPVRRPGVQSDRDPLQARSIAKLAGEAAVKQAFAGTVLIPRVGIMVGPRDPSHRFTWWPLHFLRAINGTADPVVLGPGDPERTVQYSDARDIADWLISAGVSGHTGTYNTVGPLRTDTLREVLAACAAAAHDACPAPPASAQVHWEPDEHWLGEELSSVAEEDRPLWYPEPQIPQQAIDSTAAAAAGLRFRPIRQTAADTLAWALENDADPLTHFREPSRPKSPRSMR